MAEAKTIDVAELVESRKLGKVQIGIWALAFLMVFADGFDFSGPLAGAPAILRAFGAQKTELGWVFSLGNFGALLGAYLFGYVNDRFGRRAAALAAVLCYTLPALGSGFATSLTELGIYRFVVGLGVGGIMPTAIAYLVEIAPKRFRVTMVMCGVLGFTTGIAVCGQVAAWLIPIWGWQSVFFLPACTGLALFVFLYFALPESLRYLTLHKPESDELRRRVKSLAPELDIGPADALHHARRSRAGEEHFAEAAVPGQSASRHAAAVERLFLRGADLHGADQLVRGLAGDSEALAAPGIAHLFLWRGDRHCLRRVGGLAVRQYRAVGGRRRDPGLIASVDPGLGIPGLSAIDDHRLRYRQLRLRSGMRKARSTAWSACSIRPISAAKASAMPARWAVWRRSSGRWSPAICCRRCCRCKRH